MFFDAHIHNLKDENGGFIIGLEGFPKFDDVLDNNSALQLHNPNKNYISFYYITMHEIYKSHKHKYLKYHPRREKYLPNDIIKSIKINNPRCVILDTLNEPFWQPYDYWKIAKECSNIIFIFAHAGGYLINDFIKICHFQRNVWLDFALTHTNLGHLGDRTKGLLYVNQAIKYALNSSFNNRILLSSDYPFFSQSDVVKFYKRMKVINLLNNNFIVLKELIL